MTLQQQEALRLYDELAPQLLEYLWATELRDVEVARRLHFELREAWLLSRGEATWPSQFAETQVGERWPGE